MSMIWGTLERCQYAPAHLYAINGVCRSCGDYSAQHDSLKGVTL